MLTCERCGYQWFSRSNNNKPKTCPKCKSPYWQKPLTKYWKSVREKNDTNKLNKKIEKIADGFRKSKYFIAACGCRDVYKSELIDVLKILFDSEGHDIKNSLDELYENHPDTIALNKSFNNNPWS